MRDNIIEKLEGPSSWLNSYVIERKRSGKLRICLDHKPLNKAHQQLSLPGTKLGIHHTQVCK